MPTYTPTGLRRPGLSETDYTPQLIREIVDAVEAGFAAKAGTNVLTGPLRSTAPISTPGPFYYDVDAGFTDRKAVLTIRQDTGATAPTNIQPTTHIITRSKGDNATFVGATSIYAQTRDRSDVVAGTKGVLYTAQFDVNPLVARNNSPFDDADCIVLSNSDPGAFKATDGLYLGHNAAFGTNHEWITGLQVAANCDYAFFNSGNQGTGLELRGTYANYGIDFRSGTFTGFNMRLGNNQPGIAGRNAADNADLTMLKLNTNNDVAIGNAGTIRANCAASQLGFFGTTPIAKQTLAAAATDAATTQTLANSIRTVLIAYGIAA